MASNTDSANGGNLIVTVENLLDSLEEVADLIADKNELIAKVSLVSWFIKCWERRELLRLEITDRPGHHKQKQNESIFDLTSSV